MSINFSVSPNRKFFLSEISSARLALLHGDFQTHRQTMRMFLLLCVQNATQIELPIFLYFWINEVSKVVESVSSGQPAVVSVVIVRGQTVVTCSLYVDSPQILSQRSPVSEEEQCNLRRKYICDARLISEWIFKK
jgi:hypothetical protein